MNSIHKYGLLLWIVSHSFDCFCFLCLTCVFPSGHRNLHGRVSHAFHSGLAQSTSVTWANEKGPWNDRVWWVCVLVPSMQHSGKCYIRTFPTHMLDSSALIASSVNLSIMFYLTNQRYWLQFYMLFVGGCSYQYKQYSKLGLLCWHTDLGVFQQVRISLKASCWVSGFPKKHSRSNLTDVLLSPVFKKAVILVYRENSKLKKKMVSVVLTWHKLLLVPSKILLTCLYASLHLVTRPTLAQRTLTAIQTLLSSVGSSPSLRCRSD